MILLVFGGVVIVVMVALLERSRGRLGEPGQANDLAIPDSRPFFSDSTLWLIAFVMIQWVAFGLAMELHPAGFDDCEAAPSAGAEQLQLVIAGVAVSACIALAIWRLRGLRLALALAAVGICGLGWAVLLLAEQNC